MQPDLFDGADAPSKPDPLSPTPKDDGIPPAENTQGDERSPASPPETEAFAPMTLGDARERYSDANSTNRYRGQYRSAFNSTARVLGLPIGDIPADPNKLKPLLDAAIPSTAGISRERWPSILSLARRGLRDLGVDVVMARCDLALTQPWQDLYDEIPGLKTRYGLSRFFHALSRKGVTPESFNLEDFANFRTELEAGSLGGDPAAICRQTARLWNRMVPSDANWPQVCLPVSANPRRVSLEWGAFPSSLTEEIERFLSSAATSDPFEDTARRALRPSTLDARRSLLKILASDLVLSGHLTLAEVTSLKVVVDPENLSAAMKHMRTRAGGLRPYHLNYIALARTIARHWLGDEQTAIKLANLIDRVTDNLPEPPRAGLKPKNRARLRQFDDPANINALHSLPLRVLHEVKKKAVSTHKDAIRLMYACQVALLTTVPIRVKNLTALEWGKSFIDYGKGSQRMVRIHLLRGETKNHNEYHAPVPERFFPLFDAWQSRYRPLITGVQNNLLFPNPTGVARSKISLAVKLKEFIERETGLVMNPHLFRHLAAKLYLAHDPNGVETVRQLLGHTSIETTMRAYAEFQGDAAFHRHDQVLQAPEKRTPLKRAKKPKLPPYGFSTDQGEA